MINKNITAQAAAGWQKTALLSAGIILSLVLLEFGIRFWGFIVLSVQEYGDLRSLKQKGVYRILCLGESSTQRQFPPFLEQVLNDRNLGVRFRVIDKGKGGTNSVFILEKIEAYLSEYHPDMVVAMMGINDKGVKYYQDIPESGTWLFKHCRLYRLGRLLGAYFSKKVPLLGVSRTYGYEEGKKSIEIRPKNEKTWAGLSRIYHGKDLFSQTEDSFKKAIQKDPSDSQAYLGLGFLYQKSGKWSEAENAFNKAIAISPRDDRAWVALGWFYKGKGQSKSNQAENSFKKAIEINPRNELAYVELGQLYQVHGEFSKAGDAFKQAIQIDPHNDEAYVGLGFFYNHSGELAEAEASFKKAAELNPANERAFFELGWLYRRHGKMTQALEFFKKDVTFHPNDGRALSAMSSLYEELGQPELAKEYAEKAKWLGSGLNAAVTVNNYRKLKRILDPKGIKLVCVQYPMRSVAPLKLIFEDEPNVLFVDNERVFKEAVKKESYGEYFRDMYAGDFGHCTAKGNRLIAQNIAAVIMKSEFHK